ALARVRRRGITVAVLFLDLDRFKLINDSLGHEVGDHLLVEVAERLRTCVRPEDLVGRFGGDEFAILLEDISGPDAAVQVADRIIDALRQPFTLASREVFLATSVGIAVNHLDTREPGDRKSTRLNSSHVAISYAVFCL